MKKVSLLLTAVVLSAAVAFAGDGGKKDKKSAKKEACSKEQSSCCASKKTAKNGEAKVDVAVSKEEMKSIRAVDINKGEVLKADNKLMLSEN